jgi:hypothetical protein
LMRRRKERRKVHFLGTIYFPHTHLFVAVKIPVPVAMWVSEHFSHVKPKKSSVL